MPHLMEDDRTWRQRPEIRCGQPRAVTIAILVTAEWRGQHTAVDDAEDVEDALVSAREPRRGEELRCVRGSRAAAPGDHEASSKRVHSRPIVSSISRSWRSASKYSRAISDAVAAW